VEWLFLGCPGSCGHLTRTRSSGLKRLFLHLLPS
jgi:hypothetical protein